MGRYSRKDMIEFANFAKSYQSPKKVKDAYAAYLDGARIVTPLGFGTSIYLTIINANKVFINGMCVKSRDPDEVVLHDIKDLKFLAVDSWDNKLKILHLKTMEKTSEEPREAPNQEEILKKIIELKRLLVDDHNFECAAAMRDIEKKYSKKIEK